MAFAALVARFALAGTLAAAGVAKIVQFSAFVDAVDAYAIVPKRLLKPASAVVPVFELVAAALLLMGLMLAVVPWLTAAALALFAVAIAISLGRGRQLQCACFGVGAGSRMTWFALVRNGALIVAAAAVGLLDGSRALSIDEIRGVTTSTPDRSAPAAASVALLLLLSLAIAATLRRLRKSMTRFYSMTEG